MTISAIPYAILTLVIAGLALVAFGPVLDGLTFAANSTADITPYSEQRQETWGFLKMCWDAIPFVAAFAVVVFLLMNGAQRGTGGI